MYYKKHILLSLILCMLLLLSASLAPVQALGDYNRTLTIDKHLVINRNSTLQLEPRVNGFLANTSAFTYQSSNKAVANVSEEERQLSFNFTTKSKKDSIKAVKRIDLCSDKLYEDNSLEAPENIVPTEKALSGTGKAINATIAAQSFSVFVFEK